METKENLIDISNNTKEIQKIALDILLFIDEICQKNDIKYSLDGGTLIGAIREKGFIPWDDDIDIMMRRDQYDKFISIMDAMEHPKYKLLHYGPNFPNYYVRYAKVVDLDTILTESTYRNHSQLGVFVDIFPFDSTKDEKQAIRVYKKARYYSFLASCAQLHGVNRKDNTLKKYIIKLLCLPFAKLFGYKYWLKKYDKLIKKQKLESYNLVTTFAGFNCTRTIIPKDYFDNYTKADFEGHKLPVIAEYDTYLTQLYGDYMTPPPKEKQVTHHTMKIFKKEKVSE